MNDIFCSFLYKDCLNRIRFCLVNFDLFFFFKWQMEILLSFQDVKGNSAVFQANLLKKISFFLPFFFLSFFLHSFFYLFCFLSFFFLSFFIFLSIFFLSFFLSIIFLSSSFFPTFLLIFNAERIPPQPTPYSQNLPWLQRFYWIRTMTQN